MTPSGKPEQFTLEDRMYNFATIPHANLRGEW